MTAPKVFFFPLCYLSCFFFPPLKIRVCRRTSMQRRDERIPPTLRQYVHKLSPRESICTRTRHKRIRTGGLNDHEMRMEHILFIYFFLFCFRGERWWPVCVSIWVLFGCYGASNDKECAPTTTGMKNIG